MERGLAARAEKDGPREDAQLIREEVERCRGILARLSARSEDPISGRLDSCSVRELLESALLEMPESTRIQMQMSDSVASSRVSLPREAIGQALRSVARNALQASSRNTVVQIICHCEDDLKIQVADQGCGMDEEVQRRATEPFFTTRPDGEGMGLGLFLARSVVERLDGSLEIQSETGRGTTTTLRLPFEATEAIRS